MRQISIDSQKKVIDNNDNSYRHFINITPVYVDIAELMSEGVRGFVGICGELAADTSLTKTFLEFGVDELSIAPGMVLELRKTVGEL